MYSGVIDGKEYSIHFFHVGLSLCLICAFFFSFLSPFSRRWLFCVSLLSAYFVISLLSFWLLWSYV